MNFNNQDRQEGLSGDQECHPERSEGSRCSAGQILRCAQDDNAGFGR